MIKLSRRLQAISSFVDACDLGLIDVGCDHALLSIYLQEKYPDLKVIASDVRSGPLQRAKENIEKYGLSSKIVLKLGNGVDPIEEGIDTVVISGMGTDTILDILREGKEKLDSVKKLVLSANQKFPKLRVELSKMGYYISKEKIVWEEGKYYIVMEVRPGCENYSEREIFFGPYLLQHKDELFIQYYTFLLEKEQKLYQQLPEDHPLRSSIKGKIEKLMIELSH